MARIHLTPRRRESVARTVSPETRLCVIPSSRRQPAPPSQKGPESTVVAELLPRRAVEQLPQGLGALCSSKASRVRRGREDLATRASRPLALKSWIASRTVCWPHPRFEAICGASTPLKEARSICERRRMKASLERSPTSKASHSFSENGRTKIGDFMATTVTHTPKPILKLH